MRIDYLGHACFLVTGTAGTRIAFDPYEPGCFGGALRYAAPDVAADLVLLSHGHADHGAAGQISGSPRVVDSGASGEFKDAAWRGLATFHDDSGGAARGVNTVLTVTLEKVTFCHLGDLGHPLSPAEVEQIGKVDVLFAPVGGHFTIDAAAAIETGRLISPRVFVPMHFKTDKVDFPIAPLDDFLKLCPWPVVEKGPAAEFTAADLPGSIQIWRMEPAR